MTPNHTIIMCFSRWSRCSPSSTAIWFCVFFFFFTAEHLPPGHSVLSPCWPLSLINQVLSSQLRLTAMIFNTLSLALVLYCERLLFIHLLMLLSHLYCCTSRSSSLDFSHKYGFYVLLCPKYLSHLFFISANNSFNFQPLSNLYLIAFAATK